MSIEGIYNGVADCIEDKLYPYLAEQEIDNIKVPDFKKILRSSTFDILGLKIYPTLMMEYGRIIVERETTNSDRYIMPVSFYAISKGSVPEILQKTSERYVWALKNLFEENVTLDGSIDRIDITGYEFSKAISTQTTFVHFGIIYANLDVLVRRTI